MYHASLAIEDRRHHWCYQHSMLKLNVRCAVPVRKVGSPPLLILSTSRREQGPSATGRLRRSVVARWQSWPDRLAPPAARTVRTVGGACGRGALVEDRSSAIRLIQGLCAHSLLLPIAVSASGAEVTCTHTISATSCCPSTSYGSTPSRQSCCSWLCRDNDDQAPPKMPVASSSLDDRAAVSARNAVILTTDNDDVSNSSQLCGSANLSTTKAAIAARQMRSLMLAVNSLQEPENSLFGAVGNSPLNSLASPGNWRPVACICWLNREIPCSFPWSRKFSAGDGFGTACLHHQARIAA